MNKPTVDNPYRSVENGHIRQESYLINIHKKLKTRASFFNTLDFRNTGIVNVGRYANSRYAKIYSRGYEDTRLIRRNPESSRLYTTMYSDVPSVIVRSIYDVDSQGNQIRDLTDTSFRNMKRMNTEEPNFNQAELSFLINGFSDRLLDRQGMMQPLKRKYIYQIDADDEPFGEMDSYAISIGTYKEKGMFYTNAGILIYYFPKF